MDGQASAQDGFFFPGPADRPTKYPVSQGSQRPWNNVINNNIINNAPFLGNQFTTSRPQSEIITTSSTTTANPMNSNLENAAYQRCFNSCQVILYLIVIFSLRIQSFKTFFLVYFEKV